MEAERLDGLVLFKQESMYSLTGYETAGYMMLQAMHIGADGSIALLTRVADAYPAAFTSVVEVVRVWVDGEGAPRFGPA